MNKNSFNEKMTTDMKKCVTRGSKEHGVTMYREKQIIENLKYSEEWFIQAYEKLKKVCGGADKLVEVDPNEFTDILGCIKGDDQEESKVQMKEMKELIDMC